ncbi:uncharacterized protein LOC135942965 [Cloeon dipterum]|uniref:uncharacterized protein LOC135942965 n=1 Tax=Cloeon dipterum TaxID=197152 RepID=UPI00321F6800
MDFAEIDPQDVSLELQRLMEDLQDLDNTFSDILSNQMGSPHLSKTNTANLNHSPVHSGASYGNEASNVPAINDLQQCPVGAVPYASPTGPGFYSSGTIGCNSNAMMSGNGSHRHLSALKGAGGFSQRATRNGTGKTMDKSSKEYQKLRLKNNIAVRKWREKEKLRSREISETVANLANENMELEKNVESLTEQLSLLKSMLGNNAGSLPEHMQRDLENELLMLRQQQHLGHGSDAAPN